tara:strand:- start:5072 stop:5635 length:564 start_codon:yes stop_codon:yes gene_type:complete
MGDILAKVSNDFNISASVPNANPEIISTSVGKTNIQATLANDPTIQASALIIGAYPRLVELSDVDITGLVDGYILVYDESQETWIVQNNTSGTALQVQITNNDNDITQIQTDIITINQELDVNYDREIDELPDGNILKGWTIPGSDNNTPSWRIQKITFTGGDVSYKFANGNVDFDKVWDNRLSYTY